MQTQPILHVQVCQIKPYFTENLKPALIPTVTPQVPRNPGMPHIYTIECRSRKKIRQHKPRNEHNAEATTDR